MKKYFHPVWFTITLLLCIVFAVLLMPMAIEQLGTVWGILAVIAGLVVIWSVYIVRAIVFASWEKQ